MNASNLEFKTAAHAEVFADQYANKVRLILIRYRDEELRKWFLAHDALPAFASKFTALTILRELQRRLEVRELEGE